MNRATRAKRNAAGKVKAKEGQEDDGMEEEESRMERAMREAAEENDEEDRGNEAISVAESWNSEGSSEQDVDGDSEMGGSSE